MNYQAIYEDLITERRTKEADLIASGGYRESHHILPRSLGGGNEPENLIVLTPEDHVRAHLLLAKIHGSKQWASVKMLIAGYESRGRIITNPMRQAHGAAKRAWSQHMRNSYVNPLLSPGAKAKHLKAVRRDTSLYTWFHKERGAVKASRYEASSLAGLSGDQVWRLLNGTDLSTRDGWFCLDVNPDMVSGSDISSERMKKANPMRDPSVVEKVRTSTPPMTPERRAKAAESMHSREAKAKRIETLKTSEAWSRFQERNRQPKPGARGENHPNYNSTEYLWRHKCTGETVEATKLEMYNRYGGHRPNWNKVVVGKYQSTCGWTLAEA